MARRGRRYGRGALGGAAVIAATIGALHYFQVVGRPSMSPSITGQAARSCVATSAVTSCRFTGPLPSVVARPTRYRDGSYVAQGRYLTPGGAEAIGVQLKVAGGRIVTSEIQVEATSPTARQFQRQFATRLATRVLSQPLAAVSVTRVAGASLTSLGFDNALAQIRGEARVNG